MTTLAPLPPTPTPDPPEEQPSRHEKKKVWAVLTKLLWRPILAVVLVIHGVILFMPLEPPKPAPKPSPSIDPNAKVKRVSLLKKTVPKPKPKPKLPKIQAKLPPKPKPKVAPKLPPPEEPPIDDFDDSVPEDPLPKQSESTEAQTGSAVDICNLGEVLADLGAEAAEGVGGPRPEDFNPRSRDFYYGPDGQYKPEVGDMVKVTIYRETDQITETGIGVSTRRDGAYIASRLKEACEKNQATFTQKDFDDGELYVIAKGKEVGYISIARGTTVSASFFVIAWNVDPTKPAKSN